MRVVFFFATFIFFSDGRVRAAQFVPAPQRFRQEIATSFVSREGLPEGEIQLIEIGPQGTPRAFTGGRWFECGDDHWRERKEFAAGQDRQIVVPDASDSPLMLSIPWRDVLQVLRWKDTLWIATADAPFLVTNGTARALGWPSKYRVNQIAADDAGTIWVASSAGL